MNQIEAKQRETLGVAPINTPIIFADHDEEKGPCQPKMRILQDLYNSTDECI